MGVLVVAGGSLSEVVTVLDLWTMSLRFLRTDPLEVVTVYDLG